jgi:glutathione-regulated potassium-efflux system ancillary protein KefC
MHEIRGMAALWLGLALIATLLSIWFHIATALSGTGAIDLTFLAGAEFDPVVFKAKLKGIA